MALLVAGTLIAGVAACGGDDDDDAAGGTSGGEGGGDSLVAAIGREPSTLDVQKVDDNGKDFVTWRIVEGLVDLDVEGNLVPQLATDLPVVNPDDPTKWTVTLRDDVTFSDGEKFDADAVVKSVERVLDPAFESTYVGSELSTLKSATATDATKVEFTTSEPDPIFDYKLRFLRIVAPEAAADEEAFAANPIGTGPYKLDKWNRGSDITLVANDEYYGDAPSISNIEIRFIPDEGTRIQALQAGEIDLAADVSPDQADEVPQLITADQGAQVGLIRFDETKEPYSDVRFRQALNYALDKDALSDQLYNGLFEPATCQVTPPQAVGSNDDLKPYDYDLDKAKELISEAGADGATINVDWTSSIFAKDREYGEAIASMWREAGLDVQMTFNEPSTFVDKIYARGADSPEMIYTEADTPFNHAVRAAGIVYAADGAASGNIGEVDPEFQDLLHQAFTELDADKRDDLYDQLQARQCEQAHFVYLLVRRDTYGAAENITYQPRQEIFAKMYFDEVTLG
ncbi:MAG TPA: ABC transporter substrate-binding protein [Acidimicrobiales bacterium]|nr:ABC transporter substrate-binding protein [Acidimicrobiales bacterium]